MESKETDGLAYLIHQRPMEDSAVNMVRSDVTMRGISMKTFEQFGNAIEKVMGEASAIESFKILERHSNGMPKVGHMITKKIPFISQRENVLEIGWEDISEKQKFAFKRSIKRNDIPEKDNIIRIQMLSLQLITEDGPDIKYTEFSNFNLGGMIPARLLNMAMARSVST